MDKFHTALGRERNRVVSEVQTMTLTVSESSGSSTHLETSL